VWVLRADSLNFTYVPQAWHARDLDLFLFLSMYRVRDRLLLEFAVVRHLFVKLTIWGSTWFLPFLVRNYIIIEQSL
jgi:hypothetical protein